MARIGFVGLGTMGLATAKSLIKAGHTVVGFDPAASTMTAHRSNGGQSVDSPAEAAKGADFVITMLPNGGIVRHAIFDVGGVIEGRNHLPRHARLDSHLRYAAQKSLSRGLNTPYHSPKGIAHV
jgi:3-hydroxyisobutyrate dehydrogenase-like beta-hydroxyacid dehydrogenase